MIEVLAPIKQKATKRLWTQNEFHELPEGPPYFELENGELIEMARPELRHQDILDEFISLLRPYLREKGFGKAWSEVELDITPTQTYVPDLTYLANEHFNQIEEGQRILGAPDLVVEISSPSTMVRDRTIKLRTYQQAAVPWYWFIESNNLTIWEFKNSAEGFLLAQVVDPGRTFAPSLFPGLTFNLAERMGEAVQAEGEVSEP